MLLRPQLLQFALTGGAAFAQNFPTKPITILVGFARRGLTDVLARLLAPTMSQELGQAVVIENKAGASGNVATELVVKAPADGHTLLFSNISQIAINPHAYASMRVDPVKQLTHIAAIAEGDMLLAVNADVPANNVQEFVKLAKDQPGKLNYFTSGAGGMLHVAAEVFKLKTGTNISPVHYRGSGASIPEFLAGQTQMGIEALPVLAQHVKSGKVKALMVPSTKRSPILPDVPTSAEAGYPDLILTGLVWSPRAPRHAASDDFQDLCGTCQGH